MSLLKRMRAGQHLCDVEGQDAQDLLRSEVPDGCAHGRRSRALIGRGLLSFVTLGLGLGRLRAERADTLEQGLS